MSSPCASRTRRSSPGPTSAGSRTTRPSGRWTTAYPRASVAAGDNAATLETGRPGILHGTHSYVLQDQRGQIVGTHSISAGLDYPGVGPEHAYLKDSGRVRYTSVGDTDALDAFFLLTRTEGIMPALEPAHALAWLKANPHPGTTLLTLSGRGDKDIHTVATASGHQEYLA